MASTPSQQVHDKDQDPAERSPVIAAVHALLDRHGVPERKRLVTLEAAVGLDYNQIRRRMKGDTLWTVEEIAKLAYHFREPVFNIVGAFVDGCGEPGTLRVGGVALPCSIWTGAATPTISPTAALVAIRSDPSGCWAVVPPSAVGAHMAYEIKRLVFEPPPPRRIAVVDDDADLTASAVEFLRQKGLDATPYRTQDEFRAALESLTFDGFILDWVMDEGTVGALLPIIRSRNPSAPIIILTGQIHTGVAQEDELARALAAYRAQLYEKPTRMLSLFNALELGFDGAPPLQANT